MSWGIVSKPAKLTKVRQLVPDAQLVLSYGYVYCAVTADDRHVYIDIHGPNEWRIIEVDDSPAIHWMQCPSHRGS